MAKREPGMQSICMREKMGGLNPPITYSRLINESIQQSAYAKLNFLGLGNIIYSNIMVAVLTLLLWRIYWKGNGCLDIKKVAITAKHYTFDPSLASGYTYQLCHIIQRYATVALSMLSNTSSLLEQQNIFPQDAYSKSTTLPKIIWRITTVHGHQRRTTRVDDGFQ